MDEAQVRAGLHQAFAHLKRGEKTQALDILKQTIQYRPDDANAWWLLANAVDDSGQRKVALQRAITFDPHHQQARAALEALTGQALPLPPPKPDGVASLAGRYAATAPALPTEGSNADNNGKGLLGILLLAAMVAVVAGIMLAVAMRGMGDDAVVRESLLNTPSPNSPFSDSVIVIDPSMPMASVVRPTLPPVVSETPTVLATYPTNTPRPTLQRPPTRTPFVGTPRATLNRDAIGQGGAAAGGGAPVPTAAPEIVLEIPAAVGEDYWTGFTNSMNDFAQNGGYYRFYDFPVKFFQGSLPNASFQFYIEDALAQIGRVVPIERTDNPDEADLFLEFMPRIELQVFCSSQNDAVEGCGALFYNTDVYWSTGRVEYIGYAAIASDTDIPEVVIIHELLHAVGVMVHSPDRRDVMYYEYNAESVSLRMTTRDQNTLRRLYNARAFGE